jgi:hypothetical protein
LVAGAWGHAFVYVGIIVLAGVLTGGPGTIVAAPFVWVIYAAAAQSILANKYLRQGWREVGATPEAQRDWPPNAAAEKAAAPATPVTSSVADELAKLADLKARGLLTDEEFQAQKAKLLAG